MDNLLYDCMESTDWSIFKNLAATLNQYATTTIVVPSDNEMMSSDLKASGAPVVTVAVVDIKLASLRVNPWRVTGPDEIPSHAFKSCMDHLVGVLADIFNLSLLRSEVPTCFKKTTVIPVPKKNQAMCFNDYHPTALTSIIMRSFK
eukprot:g31764.t1